MPKFVLSKSKLLSQYAQVEKLADEISYSSKTNQLVTPILEKETNCMFSVHMPNELKHVQDKTRVWYLTQAWTKEHLNDLITQGVNSFVIDNEADLKILTSYLLEHDVKINLLLRMRLREMSIRTERYFVFGIPVEKSNELLMQILNDPKLKDKINQSGFHIHRKTQNMSEWRLKEELEDMIFPETLKKISIVNIGGGLPSSYANTNDKVINGIKNRVLEVKQWLNDNKIKMIIEPGRFIAAPAVRLQTIIINKYENNLVVDASVYNSDMDALIVPVKLIVKDELEKSNNTSSFVIKGSTPCSLDLFRYKVYLNNPQIGDTITFLNAGAYNFTTDFCDLDKIPTEIVE